MIQVSRHLSQARTAISFRDDAMSAVDELAETLGGSDRSALFFFFSRPYDLDALGRAIAGRFDCPVMGCTSAGEILSPRGWVERSIVGVSYGSGIVLQPTLIRSLEQLPAQPTSPELGVRALSRGGSPHHRASVLLIDGLSCKEEGVAAGVHANWHGIPLAGGSAGDVMGLGRSYVYFEGRFYSDAAIVGLIESVLPIKVFQSIGFHPTQRKMVITGADCARRLVTEIDGYPAVKAFAEAVGKRVAELSTEVFAAHPLMVRIGGENLVRSVRGVDDEGNLIFYSAIDEGVVLTLGEASGLIEDLDRTLTGIQTQIGALQSVLAFDCILRRVELKRRDAFEAARRVISPYSLVGFSTFGEQYSGVHVNHTMTGLAIGRGHD